MPLALPTIMAGINQTIMMALAMVVIASMIGVQGLGPAVLKAIANQYFTLGIFNGLAIVGIAIIFDRISQAYGQRLQKHRRCSHMAEQQASIEIRDLYKIFGKSPAAVRRCGPQRACRRPNSARRMVHVLG